MQRFGISGLGTYEPKEIYKRQNMLAHVDEKFLNYVGIEELHIADEKESPCFMGIEAAKEALEKAGMSPEEIDGLVVGTCTPDHILPATSANVQGRLGLKMRLLLIPMAVAVQRLCMH